jgi:5'(3')-deoxyribonucleotidase
MHALIRRYARPVTVFVDQDGPLADFEAALRAQQLSPTLAKMRPGFYRNLPVTAGAREALAELQALPEVQVFVATKIPDANALAAAEKIQWLHEHFPEMGERIIVTPNKACLGTASDYLIDDRPTRADAGFFPGIFLHFGSPCLPDWPAVLREMHWRRGAAWGAPFGPRPAHCASRR